MGGHLTKDPPTDDSKEQWMEEDARLFIQIRNSIDNKILGLVNHCEYFKELIDYWSLCFLERGMFLGYLMCVKHSSIRETGSVTHRIFYGLQKDT